MRRSGVAFIFFMLALLGGFNAQATTTVCSVSSATTYNDNVVISGTGCIWNANVTVNGSLSIPAGNTLTVTPSASYTSPIIGINKASSDAVIVYGNLSISTTYGSLMTYYGDVTFKMLGASQRIYVGDGGYLNGDARNRLSAQGAVYITFTKDSGIGSWRGIYGDAGAKIRLVGTSTLFVTNAIQILGVGNSNTAIEQLGLPVLLTLKYMYIDSANYGIYVHGRSNSGSSNEVSITNNTIGLAAYGIYLYDTGALANCVISNNSITYSSYGIVANDFDASSEMEISSNILDSGSEGVDAIYAYSVDTPSSSDSDDVKLDISSNQVNGGGGIYLGNWSSSGNCNVQVTNNTFSDIYRAGVAVYNSNSASCSPSSFGLGVLGNSIGFATTVNGTGIQIAVSMNPGPIQVENNIIITKYIGILEFVNNDDYRFIVAGNHLSFDASAYLSTGGLLFLEGSSYYPSGSAFSNNTFGPSVGSLYQVYVGSGDLSSANINTSNCSDNTFTAPMRNYPTDVGTVCL